MYDVRMCQLITHSCPGGFEKTPNGTACKDLDECAYHPCGPGAKCHNIDQGHGWYCQCPGFTCTNCSCSGDLGPGSVRDRSLGIGSNAIAIMILCLLAYLSKNSYFV